MLPQSALLTADVDTTTGLCADGYVRIAQCAEASKGYGAFAAKTMSPPFEVGRYVGEVITLSDLVARYGGGGIDPADEFENANRQAAWEAERASRGVSSTGHYLFNVGPCPRTDRAMLVDAEDPLYANWTRFINHAAKRPNLEALREVIAADDPAEASTPVVRFVLLRPIAPGDELLFDYGDGFDVDLMNFIDD